MSSYCFSANVLDTIVEVEPGFKKGGTGRLFEVSTVLVTGAGAVADPGGGIPGAHLLPPPHGPKFF